MQEIRSAARHFYLMAGIAMTFAGSLHAQENQQTGQDQVAELLSCGTQVVDQERLACYDRLRDTYLNQVSGEVPPVEGSAPPAPLAQPTPLAQPVPAATAADPLRDREEAEFGVEHHQSNKSTQEITSGVVGIDRNALGGLVLTLDNEQIWQQSDRTRIQIKIGDQVTISRGAMSAFYLRVNEGQKRARFNRVR